MATKTMHAYFVIAMLCLLLSNQVRRSEARVLVADDVKGSSSSYEGVRSPSYDMEKEVLPGDNDGSGSVDSYRPTNPGHSPGIGHSKHD